MRQNLNLSLMKMNLLFKTFILILAGIGATSSWAQTTFDYTGGLQTYTVPIGVTSIEISSTGAIGGNETGGGAVVSAPGNGAQMIGTFTVAPGEVLTLLVGEEGGSAQYVGGGGGGSFVWDASDDLLIAAGGGGGAGYTDIGGSSYLGLDASTSTAGVTGNGMPGGAGTAGTGGSIPAAPTYASGGAGWLSGGNNGTVHGCLSNSNGGQRPLDGGAGGTGGGDVGRIAPGGYGGGGGGNARCGAVGGGGGGGYSGGGAGGEPVSGGYNGGGGGGSFNSGTDQTNTAGVGTGNGQIIITELCSSISITPSAVELCIGESLTLTGEAESGADVNWDGGAIDGEAFFPFETGIITFTASTDSDADCDTPIEIVIFELPDVDVTVEGDFSCAGDAVTLTGSGADFYGYEPGFIEDGVPFIPEPGVTLITIFGVDETTECSNELTFEITIYELPEVIALVSDDAICLGEELTLTGSGATEYAWDPDTVEDDMTFTPTETGTYTYELEGIDDNGCVNYDTVVVTVYEPLEITYTVVEEMFGDDGEIDITVTGGNPAYTFDWDNDGTGDYDDEEDLTGLAGGTYIVAIEDAAGCTATETIALGTQLSIDEISKYVSVYPNPTVDILNIQLEGGFTFTINSSDGKILFNGTVVNNSEVSMAQFAEGVYFVVLKQDNKTSVLQFVKE